MKIQITKMQPPILMADGRSKPSTLRSTHQLLLNEAGCAPVRDEAQADVNIVHVQK